MSGVECVALSGCSGESQPDCRAIIIFTSDERDVDSK